MEITTYAKDGVMTRGCTTGPVVVPWTLEATGPAVRLRPFSATPLFAADAVSGSLGPGRSPV